MRAESDVDSYRALAEYYFWRLDEAQTGVLILEEAMTRYPNARQRPLIWITLSTMRIRLSDAAGASLAISRAQAEPAFAKYDKAELESLPWSLICDVRRTMARNTPALVRQQLLELKGLCSRVKLRYPDALKNGRYHVAALAHNYVSQGDLASASEILKNGLAAVPPDKDRAFEFLELAKLRLQLADRVGAREAFREALKERNSKNAPHDAIFPLEAAQFCLESQDLQQCRIQLNELKTFAVAGPGDANCSLFYGLINARLLTKLEPISVIRKKLLASISSASPGHTGICDQHTLVTLYMDNDKLDPAYQLLQKMARDFPNDAVIMTRLADVCRQTHRNEEARKIFNRALSIDPGADWWPIWFDHIDTGAIKALRYGSKARPSHERLPSFRI